MNNSKNESPISSNEPEDFLRYEKNYDSVPYNFLNLDKLIWEGVLLFFNKLFTTPSQINLSSDILKKLYVYLSD